MTTWEQRVNQIKARLRAASGPGFTGADHEDTFEERWDGRVVIGEGWWESDQEYRNERQDASFLAHAYDDIADLLSENERLFAEAERLRAEVAHWMSLAQGLEYGADLLRASRKTPKPKETRA